MGVSFTYAADHGNVAEGHKFTAFTIRGMTVLPHFHVRRQQQLHKAKERNTP
jgi:hypothetical protein